MNNMMDRKDLRTQDNEDKFELEYIEDEECFDAEDEEFDSEDIEYEEEVIIKDVTCEEDMIIQDMADFLKIFGDYSRIKIMECIMDIKYTVGDFAVFTGLTQSAVSHHLKILRQAKIVVSEKDGKYVYYVVSDKHVKEIYNITRTHIEEFKKTITLKQEHDELNEIFQMDIDKKFSHNN